MAKRIAAIVLGVIACYLAVAYLVIPGLYGRYAHRHPALESIPGITYTGDGHPGDPLNVGLIGAEDDLLRIMIKAQWHPADALSFKSSLRIAAATVLRRPYEDAPVSNLYLFGRKEDLAFEQPVGDDPRKRHHVRFWKADKLDEEGRPFWIGSVTYDERVGLSHTTGQITHHIDGNVDAERDRLMKQLRDTGDLAETYEVPDFHKVREGRNGGGDAWHTDGTLDVGVIKAQP